MTRRVGRARVAGTGASLPATAVTSAAIEARLGLEAGWIERRTGIRERRIAGEGEGVSDLAVAAGAGALQAAGVEGDRVGLLVLATSTPDHPLPATAPLVASRLGLRVAAFDLAAACTGFVYGLALAERWLAATPPGEPDAVLLIAANVLSRRVNWDDAATAPLFGDGAGAVVLCRTDAGNEASAGILSVDAASDGTGWADIHIPAGGSRRPVTADALARGETFMVMAHGGQLFRRAVGLLTASARRALERAALAPEGVDWFVPHQGGRRIIESSAEALGVPEGRVVSNVACCGNTSAASIPLALHEAAADGRLRAGDSVLLAAAGAGLTAGAAVLRWG